MLTDDDAPRPDAAPPPTASAAVQRLMRGPLWWSVLRHGGTLALAMVSHAVVNLVDLWLVGKLGSSAVAGVHVATTVGFLPVIFGNGIAVATMAAVAQQLGRGDHDAARETSARGLGVMVVLGLVVGSILALLTGPCVDLQGATGEARAIGFHYLLVSNLGTVCLFMLMQSTASMRAAGETWMPVALLVGANLLNLLLDLVLIFGWDPIGMPAFGAPGAAYASVIARGLAGALGVAWLRRRQHPLRLTRPRLDAGSYRELLGLFRVGGPQSAQMFVRALVVILLTALGAAMAGEPALAALGVTTRLDTVVLFAAAGFASAGTTLVGHRLGAGETELAREAAQWAGFMAAIAAALLAGAFALWAEPVVRLFVTGADAAVLQVGAGYLAIAALSHPFACLSIAASGGINGAGRTVPPLALDAIGYGLVLPLALWAVTASVTVEGPANLEPLWWVVAAVNAGLGVAYWVYLRRGDWVG